MMISSRDVDPRRLNRRHVFTYLNKVRTLGKDSVMRMMINRNRMEVRREAGMVRPRNEWELEKRRGRD